tara:strand:+ start:80 stop:355 length:276 start_codon:yes stop_codon:yes gene_type:complete
MTEIILLIIIMCIAAVNMLMLMDDNDIPQHTALDKYNDKELARSLHGLRTCVEDLDSRLTILEDSFKYHIQSTDELKPKAEDSLGKAKYGI